jgi:hypothetical protein
MLLLLCCLGHGAQGTPEWCAAWAAAPAFIAVNTVPQMVSNDAGSLLV